MAGTVANQKVEPVKAVFGEAIMQVENVTFVPDVSGSLNSKYFSFYTTGGVHHYCWFNINAAGVDPALAGSTGHVVAGATNVTAATLAAAAATVIDATTGFDCPVDGAVISITATTAGYAKPAHEGAAATGFTFEVVQYGDSAIDLGYLDGDVSIKKEEKYVDVTSHQTGSKVLSQISTGNVSSITIKLKETSVAQLRKVILGQGDSLIPDGTGITSTEVFGSGTSRQFKQTFPRARKLLLHPDTLPDANTSRDVTFWKAFPMLNDITFSGENIMSIPVEFAIYPDYTKDARIRDWCYADGTQTLT